mmetsp:Transcript_12304/g.20580  ORF Transcript_12304/g.20580 Transcript_12304/m.20580 type:complete len:314 (+) Transcript_12304:54-995(+)
MSYWDEKQGEGKGDVKDSGERKEDFQKECIDVARNLTARGAHSFLICVDGSDQSTMAFKAVLNLRRKFDHVTVFHAFSSNKPDDYPAHWRPKQLQSKFEVELIGTLPSRLGSLRFIDRGSSTVSDILNNALDAKQEDQVLEQIPDFVVMGHHGRKGPKEKATMLGSNTDLALRFLRYPCLVVKAPILSGPRSIIMAVDGSDVSKRGLDILMRLVNPKDTLTLVHFVQIHDMQPQTQATKEYYEAELDAVAPANSSFQLIDYPGSIPLTEAVTNYLMDSTADLFAIAPRARRDRSSITDYIINHVHLSVLLCKN